MTIHRLAAQMICALNPDASKDVVWGDQSWDEMMVGFFNVVFDAGMPLNELFPPAHKQAVSANH